MRTRLVSPPCLGIVYAVFKRVAACLCGERGALRPDYLRLWAAWADAMGVSVCWSVGRAQWRGCRERLIGAGAGTAN